MRLYCTIDSCTIDSCLPLSSIVPTTVCTLNPNTTFFIDAPPCRYEVCNAYGLYTIDEANVETHGFDPGLCNNQANPACSPLWTAAILDRGVRMFHRDKNHPAVLMWSLGNESGYGAAHLAMAGYLRERDGSRLVSWLCFGGVV